MRIRPLCQAVHENYAPAPGRDRFRARQCNVNGATGTIPSRRRFRARSLAVMVGKVEPGTLRDRAGWIHFSQGARPPSGRPAALEPDRGAWPINGASGTIPLMSGAAADLTRDATPTGGRWAPGPAMRCGKQDRLNGATGTIQQQAARPACRDRLATRPREALAICLNVPLAP